MTDGMLLLHFFRDFSQAQRKAILLELEIIPDNGAVDYKLSEAFQRQCFDRIVRGGQLGRSLRGWSIRRWGRK